MSSTWLPGTPAPLCLTIDQTQSIFRLVAECQALSIRLTKEFQALLGLEAVHRNSIQGTAHNMLTLGCSAWEAAYSAMLWDEISKEECEATIRQLHSKGDTAWKEVHELMFNHQLDYDCRLSTFLADA